MVNLEELEDSSRESPHRASVPTIHPLNAPRARILQEALSTNLIPPLKKHPTRPRADDNKHCLYHQNLGHTIEECVTLRDQIKELIRAGQLKKYVKTTHSIVLAERQRSPRRSPVGRDDRYFSGSRRLYYREDRSRFEKRRSRSHSRSGDHPIRGRINTISGGFVGGGPSSSTRKRHVRALPSVNNI